MQNILMDKVVRRKTKGQGYQKDRYEEVDR